MREVVDAGILEIIDRVLREGRRNDEGQFEVDEYTLKDALENYQSFAVEETSTNIHAKWIEGNNNKYCSYCGEGCGWIAGDYCGNCGAKMDLE